MGVFAWGVRVISLLLWELRGDRVNSLEKMGLRETLEEERCLLVGCQS